MAALLAGVAVLKVAKYHGHRVGRWCGAMAVGGGVKGWVMVRLTCRGKREWWRGRRWVAMVLDLGIWFTFLAIFIQQAIVVGRKRDGRVRWQRAVAGSGHGLQTRARSLPRSLPSGKETG